MSTKTLLATMIVLAMTSLAGAADPVIHVSWDESPDPILNQDYTVSTEAPASVDYPYVFLVTGSLTWRVWSTDTDNPLNVGDIGVISCPAAANFAIKLLDDSDGPGARTVKGINLVPTSSSNYSRITSGEIKGDLDGDLTLQQSSGGTGGDVTGLLIIGDGVGDEVTGDVTLPVLSGTLDIKGGITQTIDVTDKIAGGSLIVRGAAASTARIEIENFDSGETNFVELNMAKAGAWAGDLVLMNGIPASGTFVSFFGDVADTCSVDLTGDDVAGSLALGDDCAASVINGGDVTGFVQLAHSEGAGFSGTATFTGVTGEVRIGNQADMNGTLTITGDLSGTVDVTDGDLGLNGEVLINGSITSLGRVEVGVDLGGDICVGEDVDGDISVGFKMRSTGRILIDGLCDGAVTVAQSTASLSLIRMTEGLGSAGSITINDSAGDFDAGGLIHIGTTNVTPPLDPVTFDGKILIKDSVAGAGGDLTGTIRVVGCHSNDDPLDICLCGGDGGSNISIIQTDCGATQADGWDCVTGCP